MEKGEVGEMGDTDLIKQAAVHGMAKSVTENHLADLDRLRQEVEHQIYLITGLCVASVLIMGLMTWWGLSGAQGPGWQTNWIWGGAIAIGLITLFAFIASSNIKRELRDRVDRLQRQAQLHDDNIPRV